MSHERRAVLVRGMSKNMLTVQEYMRAFSVSDHAAVLASSTDAATLCDVFVLTRAKIRSLTSYVMLLPAGA